MKAIKTVVLVLAMGLFLSCTEENVITEGETVFVEVPVTEIVEVSPDLFLDINVIGVWKSRRFIDGNRRWYTFNYDGTYVVEDIDRQGNRVSKVKRDWSFEFEGMLNLGYISGEYRVTHNGRRLILLGDRYDRRQQ